eukprot:TRINITY_DN94733_c0_g1_i1.p1 TRINITY_DN94733_c0_g1~~TRINITY_DN94733_c0_g1_i1.p1  ORF type:complete len:625 (+),score=119.18 TRINITY_DN94733_c0_g1_i1:28-1875(+)
MPSTVSILPAAWKPVELSSCYRSSRQSSSSRMLLVRYSRAESEGVTAKAGLPHSFDDRGAGSSLLAGSCAVLLFRGLRRRWRQRPGACSRRLHVGQLLAMPQSAQVDKMMRRQLRMQKQLRLWWSEFWSDRDPHGDTLERRKEAQKGVVKKKRVMLLISDTGGGHRASANAIADALEELYPDQVICTIRDIWSESCPWPFSHVVQSYMWMGKRPWFWRIFFYTTTFPPVRWVSQRIANRLCKRAFRRSIECDNPDLIASLHPGNQHITLKVLNRLARRARRRIPFVTIVTDLGGAHPLWFHPEADRVFVPSKNIRDQALSWGVRESVIHMYGLPLRRPFWEREKRSRVQVREDLGLEKAVPTVLVVGGGDGVGSLQQVAEAMAGELSSVFGSSATAERPLTAQVIVICGKNESVRRRLESKEWPAVRFHVVGFVANIDELMAAADVIVTKAGPGTIAESCTRQLPIMLSSFLPGQEKGNVDFVEEGGFGEYSWQPEVIAKKVTAWLRNPEELARLSQLSAAHGKPAATLKIAEVLGREWLMTDPAQLEQALVAELGRSSKETHAEGRKGAVEAVVARLREASKAFHRAQAELREAQSHAFSLLDETQKAPLVANN